MDTLDGDELARRIAEELGDALAAPTTRPGCSGHHMAFPGTVTVPPETLMEVVRSYCRSLDEHGFDPSSSCRPAGATSAPSGPSRPTSPANSTPPRYRWRTATDARLLTEGLDEAGTECDQAVIHAGAAEMAVVMAIDEDLVRTAAIERGHERPVPTDRLLSEGLETVSENGVLGDPTGATPGPARPPPAGSSTPTSTTPRRNGSRSERPGPPRPVHESPRPGSCPHRRVRGRPQDSAFRIGPVTSTLFHAAPEARHMDTFDIGGDLTVRRLGFGAMRITGEDIIGEPDDPETAREVLRRAAEHVDLIDTADSYGPGVSERLLGETLAPYEECVVATKGGLLRNHDGDWLPYGDPDYLRNAVLCSLDRLRTDTIDLYQLHTPDPDVDFEDSVTTLAALKDDGLVEHVGLSNVSLEQLETARDHVEVATVQNQFNVATRDTDRVDGDGRRVLEACETHDIGFIPYFPLVAGDASGVDGIEEIADAHDATPEQVALAWLLERSDVTLPIPGTGSVAHLEENVAAADLELTPEEFEKLS
jgi:aryl-alcohol dehydrogenase-like predicted oxidoreductase